MYVLRMLQGENVPGSVLILQKVIEELGADGEDASWHKALACFSCVVAVPQAATAFATCQLKQLPLASSAPLSARSSTSTFSFSSVS